jgi:hypothetical protein
MFHRLGRQAMQQEKSPQDALIRGSKHVSRIEVHHDQKHGAPSGPRTFMARSRWASPPRHDIAFDDVRIEVDFLALDDEGNIALRSADRLRPRRRSTSGSTCSTRFSASTSIGVRP